MPLIRTHRQVRLAFTLIELLIVISIIALLVSLLASAIVRVFDTAKRTETSFEITKLQNALNASMKQYGDAKVLPSRLLLYNDLSKYKTDTSPLSKRSADALRRMFGQRLLQYGTFVYWDGSSNNAGQVTLEGQQCLVFYLGGVQSTTTTRTCLGFSTDPLNPMLTTGDRIGPFFEFKSSRLVPGNANGFSANALFVYLDPYHDPMDPLAKPYAYFSTTTAPNNYNPYYSVPTSVTSDCQSLEPMGGFWPYIESPGSGSAAPKYMNPNGFQIISAGPNGKFGVGGGPPGSPPTFSSSVYDPKTGAIDLDTRDNQANFTQFVLGSPQS